MMSAYSGIELTVRGPYFTFTFFISTKSLPWGVGAAEGLLVDIFDSPTSGVFAVDKTSFFGPVMTVPPFTNATWVIQSGMGSCVRRPIITRGFLAV
jgi:hypothetical protein